MKKANRDEGQNISALHPYLKCFFDKSLILYTYENPCELASSVDYPRSRIPQIFPSNKALKNFCRKKVKKRGCEIIQPEKRNEEAPGPVKDWGLNHGII